MKIRTKFLLSILLILSVYTISNIISGVRNIRENGTIELQHYEEILFGTAKNKLMSVTSIVDNFIDNKKDSKGSLINITDKEKQEWLDVIKDMKYDNEVGYFWINDDQLPYPEMIMHPVSPQLNGKKLNSTKYNVAKGDEKNLFVAMVKLCKKNGSGFIEYLWPKPGSKEPQPKLSYVKYEPSLGWIVGTGFYIDDIYAEIEKKHNEIEAREKQLIISNVISSLISFIICWLIIYYLMEYLISKPLDNTIRYIQKITEGDFSISIKSTRSDEIGIMQKAMKTMVENLKTSAKIADLVAKGSLKEAAAMSRKYNQGEFNQALGNMIKALSESVAFAGEISKGNLSAKLKSNRNGDLENALYTMIGKIAEIVKGISANVSNVTSTGKELNDSADKVANGAQEQASLMEELSASMEQMLASINQNTDNAVSTKTTAEKAVQQIVLAAQSVTTAMNAMIEIADKTSIIGEIAFKTKILALNAAVEAARAGEFGRGFAIVASEVQSLAEESNIASGEINEIVRNGVAITQQSGDILEELVPDFEKTLKLLEEISATGAEQVTNAQMINESILRISNIAQTNSMTSFMITDSSRQLYAQAEALNNAVGYFRL